MPASSDWVYGHASRIGSLEPPDRVTPSPFVRDATHPQEVAGEAARQVEEVEVGDLAGQAPDLAAERGEHRAAQGGLGVDEAIERVTAEDQRFDGPNGDRGGGARAAVEQRQLPEEAAATDGRQDDGFGAFLRGQDDLDLPARDHEQRVARILEVEHDLAAAKPPSAHRVSAQHERRIVESGEQRTGMERLAREREIAQRG